MIITVVCSECTYRRIKQDGFEVTHTYRHKEAERLIKEMGEGFDDTPTCLRAYLDGNPE